MKTRYLNILRISPPKYENCQRGGSNEYPQSMFLNRNTKINVYPCKPQFYCIKVGFKGVKTNGRVFVMSACPGLFALPLGVIGRL